MPVGYNCRHCGHSPQSGKRKRRVRTFKKRSRTQIFESIKKWVLNLEEECNRKWFTKEEISVDLQIKEHKVAMALMQLNQEGVVSQPEHKPPHDSKREHGGSGNDSSWQGDIYRVKVKKQKV